MTYMNIYENFHPIFTPISPWKTSGGFDSQGWRVAAGDDVLLHHCGVSVELQGIEKWCEPPEEW